MRLDDFVVTVAYFSIPLQIVSAFLKYPRFRVIPWNLAALAILFALFIFLCGTGHLFRCLEITGGKAFQVVNTLTAIISLATAVYLFPLIPHLLDSLDKTLEAEKESKRKLMSFMSFLCHEIRNPLFAITSTITFMGDDTNLAREQRRSLECIEQSTNLMLRLMNDVLDISKLESGKLELDNHSFNLTKLMRGAAASTQMEIQQRRRGRVQFEYKVCDSVPQQVVSDSVRILQIAFNLLSNAAKFTERGYVKYTVDMVDYHEAERKRWVKEPNQLLESSLMTNTPKGSGNEVSMGLLEAAAAAEEGRIDQAVHSNVELGVLKLQIEDSGVGINSDRLKHVFEPYAQAKLSDFRKHGGTGLGLSILKRLTEIMGGSIHVASNEGAGSTFTVYIPVLKVEGGNEMEETNDWENHELPKLLEEDKGNTIGVVNQPMSLILSDPDPLSGQDEESKAGSSLVDDNSSKMSSRASSTNDFDATATTSATNLVPSTGSGMKSVRNENTSTSKRHLTTDKVVLVVDDNDINRKLLGRMLKHFHLKVQFAENGQEAVNAIRASRNFALGEGAPEIGLVLMDWSMPVLNGSEAIQIIREMRVDVPIVAITACALEECLRELKESGANELATKPIMRDELFRICQRYLGQGTAS